MGFSQQLSLKVAGNNQQGFHVDIYDGGQRVVTRTEEFSLQLFNHDQSTTTTIRHISGQKWSGDATNITLTRDMYIPEFDADLSVSVNHQVVNAHVVKKAVRLFQPSMPGLYYILKQTARPDGKPQRYLTFENDTFPGSFVHEMFPAVGFITATNKVVGFLTDAGYKNQCTRNTKRRFSGRDEGFTGLRRLPDVNLMAVASQAEQKQNNDFISQTFGSLYNLDVGDVKSLSTDTKFKK